MKPIKKIWKRCAYVKHLEPVIARSVREVERALTKITASGGSWETFFFFSSGFEEKGNPEQGEMHICENGHRYVTQLDSNSERKRIFWHLLFHASYSSKIDSSFLFFFF